MANHASALKRMRQSEIRRIRNASFKSRVKTAVKKYLQAVETKDAGAAELLSYASTLFQKGVSKGIYHKNTSSRTIARLSRRLPSA